jgi:hypothetical protein
MSMAVERSGLVISPQNDLGAVSKVLIFTTI